MANKKIIVDGNQSSDKPESRNRKSGRSEKTAEQARLQEQQLNEAVERELRRIERRRKFFLILSGTTAILFLGIFGLYAFQEKRQDENRNQLGERIGKETPAKRMPQDAAEKVSEDYHVNLSEKKEVPEVLKEYQAVYQQHKKLIGWLRFDDKDIGGKYGFPVMQTDDNEYFLDHNSELEKDKNGAIFMDCACDVLEPSTNYILYGHKMQSGAMFGKLDRYAKESYWKKYPYFEFDTIYEKGIYQVMYVFRSHVFSEEEVAFKYYQFTEAYSKQEFDSYMKEMADMSLYQTGVSAVFGDQLLTLSTCDYLEKDGRFVVVAKKVTARE